MKSCNANQFEMLAHSQSPIFTIFSVVGYFIILAFALVFLYEDIDIFYNVFYALCIVFN